MFWENKNFYKKRLGAIIVLVSILIVIVCRQESSVNTTTKYMNVRIADKTILDDYMQSDDLGENPVICFDGYEIAHDSDTNIYYVTQNMYGDAWNGQFTTDTGQLFWAEDEYLQHFREAIAEGHIFTLYHIDEREQLLYSYQIVFTGMPIMALSIDGYDEVTTEYHGSMLVADPYSQGEKYRSTECVYHTRGGSSRQYDKKSYKLELQQKLPLLGMHNDDDWILNALYDDAGLVHNKFSIDVWRNIAADNSVANDEGMRAEYIELFMDNNYLGVYALTERIDQKLLNLSQGSILYKCYAWEIPDQGSQEEDYGFGKSFEIKYPKSYTGDMWQPLRQYTDMFCRPGNISMQEAGTILNIENAIDYNIFMLLAYGCDNLRKNTYFVAEPNYGSYVIKKVPWDMNATWGNGLSGDPQYCGTLYDENAIYDTEMWSTDIFKLHDCNEEEVNKLLNARWQALRRDILSDERLSAQLDELFGYLYASGAYERNYSCWPKETEYWEDRYIYEYVDGRLQFLDHYFEDPYFDSVSIVNEGVR